MPLRVASQSATLAALSAVVIWGLSESVIGLSLKAVFL